MPAAVSDEVRDRIEALYRSQGGRLWRAIWAFGHDADLASDVVAETFAQALARGDAIKSPAAWIWRSAFRIASGMLQDRRRNVSISGDPSYELLDRTSGLVWALEELPPRQRAVLILFYYADHPVREVATILGSSVIAVRVNLTRGRQRLKRLLEGNRD